MCECPERILYNDLSEIKTGYNEEFDAFYCKKCLEWIEEKCGNIYCEYCSRRPEKAVD